MFRPWAQRQGWTHALCMCFWFLTLTSGFCNFPSVTRYGEAKPFLREHFQENHANKCNQSLCPIKLTDFVWKLLQSAPTLLCLVALFFEGWNSPQLSEAVLCNNVTEKEDKQHNTAAGPTSRVSCPSPLRRSRYTSAADGLHWMCAPSRSELRGCATNWEHGSVSQALKEDVLKWRNLIFPSRHPSSSVSVWIEIISL